MQWGKPWLLSAVLLLATAAVARDQFDQLPKAVPDPRPDTCCSTLRDCQAELERTRAANAAWIDHVKALRAENASLKAENQALKAQIDELKQRQK